MVKKSGPESQLHNHRYPLNMLGDTEAELQGDIAAVESNSNMEMPVEMAAAETAVAELTLEEPTAPLPSSVWTALSPSSDDSPTARHGHAAALSWSVTRDRTDQDESMDAMEPRERVEKQLVVVFGGDHGGLAKDSFWKLDLGVFQMILRLYEMIFCFWRWNEGLGRELGRLEVWNWFEFRESRLPVLWTFKTRSIGISFDGQMTFLSASNQSLYLFLSQQPTNGIAPSFRGNRYLCSPAQPLAKSATRSLSMAASLKPKKEDKPLNTCATRWVLKSEICFVNAKDRF